VSLHCVVAPLHASFLVSSGQDTVQQFFNIAGRLPQDRNPLDLGEFSEVLNRYEAEMANADVRKQAWKNSTEARVGCGIVTGTASVEQGTHSDYFQEVQVPIAILLLVSELTNPASG
jgi:hypothetical protein